MKYFLVFFLISLSSLSQELFPLSSRYIGEDTVANVVIDNPKEESFVRYFSPEEANLYKAQIIDGRITIDGYNYFTDFKRARAHTIYVLDEFDQLYLCDCNQVNKIHHSSFKAGKDVKAAGEMFLFDGIIIEINNTSGHYKPSLNSIAHLMNKLEDKGYLWRNWIENNPEYIDAQHSPYRRMRPITNPCGMLFIP